LIIRIQPFLVFLAIFISGCATQHQPATIGTTEVSRDDYIEISTPIAYRVTGGLMKITVEFGIRPGVFKAEKENDLGVFYRGADHPLWSKLIDNQTRPFQLRAGGIWIPKSPSSSPRLYWISESRLLTTETLDSSDNLQARSGTDALNQIVVSKTEEAPLIGKPIGSTAVGSIIGAGIVIAIIQADIGNILLLEESNDPEFNQKILDGLHVTH
jgi:hypothetical protein